MEYISLIMSDVNTILFLFTLANAGALACMILENIIRKVLKGGK